jgi:hypothetical protein
VSASITSGAGSAETQAKRESVGIGEWIALGVLGLTATGAACGALLALRSNAADPARYALTGAITGFMLPFLCMGLISFLTMGIMLGRRAIWALEAFTRTDITGDRQIGVPDDRAPTEVLFPVNIPRHEPAVRLAGADRQYAKQDLTWLVHYVYENPTWSGREMRGMRLPSGDILADYEADVVPFLDILERMNLLMGRGPGARGALQATRDEALRRLRLP